MSYLSRESSPISAKLWEQIDSAVVQTASHVLTGRRFLHDNQIYGLTKGQASPTSAEGQVTDVQPTGNINTPLNPVLLAIAAGGGFVARAFSGDKEHLISIMKQAILYNGYALVDILQP